MSPLEALTVSKQTLVYLLPEILIILSATAMITAGPFVRKPRGLWASLSALTLVAALGLIVFLPEHRPDLYTSVVAADAFSWFLRVGLLLAGLILLGLGHDQVDDARAPEFFGSILMLHAGSMLVATANEMVFLFIGLELVSIPTYLLLYLSRRTRTTQEAATKYFYLSVFGSALFLFGLAYLYGLTGVSNLKALSYVVHWRDGAMQLPQPILATVAIVFIMAGLGFRVAAVPFHFYAPDVYQGSPTLLAALLSWIPKVIGFAAILRLLMPVFSWEPVPGEVSNLASVSDKALWITWVLAVATMTLGNAVALAQDNLKRLLAYSSIAHAGYLLIGVAVAFRNTAGGPETVLGADGIVVYLAVYALMTLGAFGVIMALDSRERPVENVDDLAGLTRTRPLSALALALCLFSLAGIPPLAGFWGKFRIFQAALEAAHGSDTQAFQLLTVLGVLNAAVGAYYYLRIIMTMVFKDPVGAPPTRFAGWPTQVAIAFCASFSLILFILPSPLFEAGRLSGAATVALPSPLAQPAAEVISTVAETAAPAPDAAHPASAVRVAQEPEASRTIATH